MPKRRDLLGRGAGLAALVGLGAMGAATAVAEPPLPADPFNPPFPLSWALMSLDRSGSMRAVKPAIVLGVNHWLAEQRRESHLMVGILMFDYWDGAFRSEWLVPWTPSDKTSPIESHQFMPAGETPLRESILYSAGVLEKMVRAQDKGLLVTQTDGSDNKSATETSMDVVLGTIADYEARGNFTFAHMGAGPEAWNEVAKLGGGAMGATLTYMPNMSGTMSALNVASSSTVNWHRSESRSLKEFYPHSESIAWTAASPGALTIVSAGGIGGSC